MRVKRRLLRHPLLIAIALCIGFGIVGADRVLFGLALGRTIELGEIDVFIVNSILTSLPFLALSFRQKQHVTPWIIGLVWSSWLAWGWLQKGVAYQRHPDGSGVDLGGALIMLFAPFFITAVCLAIDQLLNMRKANVG
jgi:hypothetical protein